MPCAHARTERQTRHTDADRQTRTDSHQVSCWAWPHLNSRGTYHTFPHIQRRTAIRYKRSHSCFAIACCSRSCHTLQSIRTLHEHTFRALPFRNKHKNSLSISINHDPAYHKTHHSLANTHTHPFTTALTPQLSHHNHAQSPPHKHTLPNHTKTSQNFPPPTHNKAMHTHNHRTLHAYPTISLTLPPMYTDSLMLVSSACSFIYQCLCVCMYVCM